MYASRGRPLFLVLSLLLTGLLLAACAVVFRTPEPTATVMLPSVTASMTMLPSVTVSPSVSPLPTFALPLLTPITPIPPPIVDLHLPSGAQVAVLLGSDTLSPYVGRTKAVALVIVNPDTALASVISLPPDIFVYLPGYTMQRLGIAYALGGFKQVSSAIQYNFGVRPSLYVFAHMNDFTNLVDELTGLTVFTQTRVLELCGDNPPGRVEMDSQQAFCYARVRSATDEADRSRRQQDLLAALVFRLTHSGTLTRLPDLFNAFQSSIDTNLTLPQLVENIPLALKLGDTGRVRYFYLSNDDLTPWQIHEAELPATVLLPDMGEVHETMRKAIAFVMTPVPLSNAVETLVRELTLTPTPTNTLTSTPTRTRTPTAYRSPLPTRTATLTPSNTPRPTRIQSATATATFLPTRTSTNTVTASPTVTDTTGP